MVLSLAHSLGATFIGDRLALLLLSRPGGRQIRDSQGGPGPVTDRLGDPGTDHRDCPRASVKLTNHHFSESKVPFP